MINPFVYDSYSVSFSPLDLLGNLSLLVKKVKQSYRDNQKKFSKNVLKDFCNQSKSIIHFFRLEQSNPPFHHGNFFPKSILKNSSHTKELIDGLDQVIKITKKAWKMKNNPTKFAALRQFYVESTEIIDQIEPDSYQRNLGYLDTAKINSLGTQNSQPEQVIIVESENQQVNSDSMGVNIQKEIDFSSSSSTTSTKINKKNESEDNSNKSIPKKKFKPRNERNYRTKDAQRLNQSLQGRVEYYNDKISNKDLSLKKLYEYKNNLKNTTIDDFKTSQTEEIKKIDIEKVKNFKILFNKITQMQIEKGGAKKNAHILDFDSDKKLEFLRQILNQNVNDTDFLALLSTPTKKQKRKLVTDPIVVSSQLRENTDSDETKRRPDTQEKFEEISSNEPSSSKKQKRKTTSDGIAPLSEPAQGKDSGRPKRNRTPSSRFKLEKAILSSPSPMKKQKTSSSIREKEVRQKITAIQIPLKLPSLEETIASIQGNRQFAQTTLQSEEMKSLWKDWVDPPETDEEYHALKAKFNGYKATSDYENESRIGIFDSLDPELNNLAIALKKIKKGDIIGEYTGTVEKDLSNDENRYVFNFTPTNHLEQEFLKNKGITDLSISAKVDCNHTAFVSHNSQKDANIDVYCLLDQEGPHIIYQAKRTIAKGEPLTIDYGKNYWKTLGIKPVKISGKASFI